MLKFWNLFGLLLVFCCLFACDSTKNRPLVIDFDQDSLSIVIKNIDPVGLRQIRDDSLKGPVLQQMISVTELPAAADTAGIPREVHGAVQAGPDQLIFKPAKPFQKGRKYRVLTYMNSKFADFQSILKNKTRFNMAPNEKVLEFL